MKKALITGITGQDGSYLAEFLLEKGYEVHGITRRISISNTQRIDHLLAANKIKIHDGDLSDGNSIVRIINEVQPDEIYNLAAQFWMRFISLDLIRRHAFIRLRHLNCMDRWRKYLRMRTLRSIHSAHTLLQSSMVSG